MGLRLGNCGYEHQEEVCARVAGELGESRLYSVDLEEVSQG